MEAKTMFDMIDGDADGKLTPAEIRTHYGLDEHFNVEGVLEKHDTSKDGALDLKEYSVVWTNADALYGELMATDGNETDATHFADEPDDPGGLPVDTTPKSPAEQLKFLFEMFDKDEDKFVTTAECMEFYGFSAEVKTRVKSRAFTPYDADADGKLSFGEYEAMHHKTASTAMGNDGHVHDPIYEMYMSPEHEEL